MAHLPSKNAAPPLARCVVSSPEGVFPLRPNHLDTRKVVPYLTAAATSFRESPLPSSPLSSLSFWFSLLTLLLLLPLPLPSYPSDTPTSRLPVSLLFPTTSDVPYFPSQSFSDIPPTSSAALTASIKGASLNHLNSSGCQSLILGTMGHAREVLSCTSSKIWRRSTALEIVFTLEQDLRLIDEPGEGDSC